MPGAERSALEFVLAAGRGITWWVRSVMGDDAYPRYIQHLARHHPGSPIPTVGQYWRDRYADMDANPGARCC